MPTLANEPSEDRMIGAGPDEFGYFGPCGSALIAETLLAPVQELEEAYARYRWDPDFLAAFEAIPAAVSVPVAETRIRDRSSRWIPAFAGMTGSASGVTFRHSLDARELPAAIAVMMDERAAICAQFRHPLPSPNRDAETRPAMDGVA